MKTFAYLLVAAVAVPAIAGPGFAQTTKPATTGTMEMMESSTPSTRICVAETSKNRIWVKR